MFWRLLFYWLQAYRLLPPYWTCGQTQFNWLKQTLENSSAQFKFVFPHQMVGGGKDYGHGGANPTHLVEWGGCNENGTTWGWNYRRAGWGSDPIHQFMVANHVSAFFHGHDHRYGYEKPNGVVYQSLRAAGSSGNGFNYYTTDNGYTIKGLPSPGHLRVTVSPSQATVDYVNTSTGQVTYSYIIPAFVNKCQGDIASGGDGIVDEAALLVFAANFGRSDCSGDCLGDFNFADNDIDGSELAVFVSDFSNPNCF